MCHGRIIYAFHVSRLSFRRKQGRYSLSIYIGEVIEILSGNYSLIDLSPELISSAWCRCNTAYTEGYMKRSVVSNGYALVLSVSPMLFYGTRPDKSGCPRTLVVI